jgi:hypothetical protein
LIISKILSLYAGFDIIFCSKVLGKHRSTFSWVVNGQYHNTVTVHAEVTPIAVKLSRDALSFSFSLNAGE